MFSTGLGYWIMTRLIRLLHFRYHLFKSFSLILRNKKKAGQFVKFMEVVKNLQVTVPFTDLITQIPAYSQFLKDMITRKKNFDIVETIAFTEKCFAFLQSNKPPKLEDPGSF